MMLVADQNGDFLFGHSKEMHLSSPSSIARATLRIG
jgi:hypothetical protein